MYNKGLRNDQQIRNININPYNVNASPVLGQKDHVLQTHKFYTPHLNKKNIQNDNLNAYVEMKYQNRKINDKPTKDGPWLSNSDNKVLHEASKENSGFVNKMEEENIPSINATKTAISKKGEKVGAYEKSDNKKLMKIQALFNAKNFECINMHHIIQSWNELSNIYDHISNNRNPINIINSMIKNFNPPSHVDFIEVFTEYNHIKQKVRNFYFLKIWSSLLFIYIHDKMKGKFDLKLITWFETIFCQLIRSVFYISLIISKALRNNFIKNEGHNIEYFSKQLQKFNFPTGIPLIKTLKTNNENIFLSLKNVLNSLDISLSMQFEKSYLKDLNCLYSCLRNLLLFFSPLLSSNYQSVFNSLSSYLPVKPQTTNNTFTVSEPNALITSTTNKRYTLVLDLDETLIHFKTENSKSKFLIRPHAYNILRNLNEHFELIIFTAAQKEYADFILNLIDTQCVISHRFYRDHCRMAHNCHIKVI